MSKNHPLRDPGFPGQRANRICIVLASNLSRFTKFCPLQGWRLLSSRKGFQFPMGLKVSGCCKAMGSSGKTQYPNTAFLHLSVHPLSKKVAIVLAHSGHWGKRKVSTQGTDSQIRIQSPSFSIPHCEMRKRCIVFFFF